MREPVEKTIDGEQYTFCQLPPKKSLKLLMRLLRIVGPTMGVAMDGARGGRVDVKTLLEADIDIARIVSTLCERLDENEVEAIVDGLLSQTIHAGNGEVSKRFDVLFGGRLPHLFKVLAEALRVEYGDFLAAGPALNAFLKAGTTPVQQT